MSIIRRANIAIGISLTALAIFACVISPPTSNADISLAVGTFSVGIILLLGGFLME